LNNKPKNVIFIPVALCPFFVLIGITGENRYPCWWGRALASNYSLIILVGNIAQRIDFHCSVKIIWVRGDLKYTLAFEIDNQF